MLQQLSALWFRIRKFFLPNPERTAGQKKEKMSEENTPQGVPVEPMYEFLDFLTPDPNSPYIQLSIPERLSSRLLKNELR
jgi:hypothetical protein